MARYPLLIVLALLAACAGSQSEQTDVLPGEGGIALDRNESLPSFVPADTAELNWARGEKAFGENDALRAQRYYIYIRRNFPYTKYAALSEVRIADCQFKRERYRVAIDGYQNFARLYPTHPQKAYALFKAARANYELIPNDLFFNPPGHEKDQSEVKDTVQALTRYLSQFPNHDYVGEAKEMLQKTRKKLVAHERYAADFYKRLGKYRGYVARLERIRGRYGDLALDPELLVEMVEAYVQLEDRAEAERTLGDLVSKFPEAKQQQQKANQFIQSLPEDVPEDS